MTFHDSGCLLLRCPLDILFKVRLNSINTTNTIKRLNTPSGAPNKNRHNYILHKIENIIDNFTKISQIDTINESNIMYPYPNCFDIDHINGHFPLKRNLSEAGDPIGSDVTFYELCL